jgi:PAS domain S-box-containing protein
MRRFTEEEIEYWRDWGLYYFVPCVAKEGTIAVLALGRNESAEPLSSEDMALLGAVAGQVATALENGRLYRQLHQKAGEIDRLREFNENVLQSLDDGLVVSDREGRILWWNRAIEDLYGVKAQSAVNRKLDEVFEVRSSKRSAAQRDAQRARRCIASPWQARVGTSALASVAPSPCALPRLRSASRPPSATSSSSRT